MTDGFPSTFFEELVRVSLRDIHALPNGVRLIGHVPHVGSEAFLHEIYPPLAECEIAELEESIGRHLPAALWSLYRVANGMHLFSGALSLSGLRRSFARSGDDA